MDVTCGAGRRRRGREAHRGLPPGRVAGSAETCRADQRRNKKRVWKILAKVGNAPEAGELEEEHLVAASRAEHASLLVPDACRAPQVRVRIGVAEVREHGVWGDGPIMVPTAQLLSTMEEPSSGSQQTTKRPSLFTSTRTGSSSEAPVCTTLEDLHASHMSLSAITSTPS